MASADYARYPGQYYDPFNAGEILVRLNNNQLTVEIPTFDDIGLMYSSTLLANTPNNFILYLYGLTQFDAYPLQVTFILDDEGKSEYFRTRSFVAEYQGEIPPEPGRPGRTEALRTMELFDASRLKPALPEPRLPFIRPPVR
jgi:hypothetical protein